MLKRESLWVADGYQCRRWQASKGAVHTSTGDPDHLYFKDLRALDKPYHNSGDYRSTRDKDSHKPGKLCRNSGDYHNAYDKYFLHSYAPLKLCPNLKFAKDRVQSARARLYEKEADQAAVLRSSYNSARLSVDMCCFPRRRIRSKKTRKVTRSVAKCVLCGLVSEGGVHHNVDALDLYFGRHARCLHSTHNEHGDSHLVHASGHRFSRSDFLPSSTSKVKRGSSPPLGKRKIEISSSRREHMSRRCVSIEPDRLRSRSLSIQSQRRDSLSSRQTVGDKIMPFIYDDKRDSVHGVPKYPLEPACFTWKHMFEDTSFVQDQKHERHLYASFVSDDTPDSSSSVPTLDGPYKTSSSMQKKPEDGPSCQPPIAAVVSKLTLIRRSSAQENAHKSPSRQNDPEQGSCSLSHYTQDHSASTPGDMPADSPSAETLVPRLSQVSVQIGGSLRSSELTLLPTSQSMTDSFVERPSYVPTHQNSSFLSVLSDQSKNLHITTHQSKSLLSVPIHQSKSLVSVQTHQSRSSEPIPTHPSTTFRIVSSHQSRSLLSVPTHQSTSLSPERTPQTPVRTKLSKGSFSIINVQSTSSPSVPIHVENNSLSVQSFPPVISTSSSNQLHLSTISAQKQHLDGLFDERRHLSESLIPIGNEPAVRLAYAKGERRFHDGMSSSSVQEGAQPLTQHAHGSVSFQSYQVDASSTSTEDDLLETVDPTRKLAGESQAECSCFIRHRVTEPSASVPIELHDRSCAIRNNVPKNSSALRNHIQEHVTCSCFLKNQLPENSTSLPLHLHDQSCSLKERSAISSLLLGSNKRHSSVSSEIPQRMANIPSGVCVSLTALSCESMTTLQHEKLTSLSRGSLTSLEREKVTCLPRERLTSLAHESMTSIQHETLTSVPRESLTSLPRESASAIKCKDVTALRGESSISLPIILRESLISLPSDIFKSFADSSSTVPKGLSAIPHGSLSAIPHDSLSAIPHDGLSAIPHDGLSAIPHDSVSAIPHDSLSAIPHDSLSVIPYDDLSAIPHDGLSAIPHDGLSAIPHDSLSAVPHDGLSARPHSGLSAIPQATLSAIPHDSLSAIPHDGFSAIPHASLSAIPHDSLSAIPHDGLSAIPYDTLSAIPHDSLSGLPHEVLREIPGERLAVSPSFTHSSLISPPSQKRESVTDVPNDLLQNLAALPTKTRDTLATLPSDLLQSLASLPSQVRERLASFPSDKRETLAIDGYMLEDVVDIPSDLRESVRNLPDQLRKSLVDIPENLAESLPSLSNSLLQSLTSLSDNKRLNLGSLLSNVLDDFASEDGFPVTRPETSSFQQDHQLVISTPGLQSSKRSASKQSHLHKRLPSLQHAPRISMDDVTSDLAHASDSQHDMSEKSKSDRDDKNNSPSVVCSCGHELSSSDEEDLEKDGPDNQV